MVERNEKTKPEQMNLRRIYLLSFLYSQGDSKNQVEIFDWFFRTGRLDQVKFPKKAPVFVKDIVPPQLHIETTTNYVKTTLRDMWKEIKSVSTGGTLAELEESFLLRAIIREQDYVLGRRPHRSYLEKSIASDSLNDPHGSILRKYLINGEEAGHPFFNDFFDSLRNRIEILKVRNPNNAVSKELQLLANGWETKHTGEKFFETNQASGQHVLE